MSDDPRQQIDDAIEQAEDQARAEGFAAGLFFGSSIAFEMGMMSPLAGMFTDLESLYPEVAGDEEHPESIGFGADVDAEEIVEELESLEGEGIEATMFEPMDGYEEGDDVPRGE